MLEDHKLEHEDHIESEITNLTMFTRKKCGDAE